MGRLDATRRVGMNGWTQSSVQKVAARLGMLLFALGSVTAAGADKTAEKPAEPSTEQPAGGGGGGPTPKTVVELAGGASVCVRFAIEWFAIELYAVCVRSCRVAEHRGGRGGGSRRVLGAAERAGVAGGAN